MDWQILWLKETGSTNDEVRQLALQGAAAGTVVVADVQAAGRGRRGSAWEAPAGKSLLCSVLLRPDFPLECWPRLTHAAALAMAEVLEECGIRPQIKWPNDLLVSGRKICGILLETFTDPQGAFVVLGFGLNVNLPQVAFPEALQATATSLLMETGVEWDREQVLDRILERLEVWSQKLDGHFAEVRQEVEQRSFLTGHVITLEAQGRVERGIARGLSEQGGLLFEDAAGEVREILSADFLRRV